jgi:phenol/toluene 2-monooxygenase (NADH) P0/A0
MIMGNEATNIQPSDLPGRSESEDRPDLTVETAQKYVCVRDVNSEGNVRFDFAIGWPDVCVELVLPQAAFDEFCRQNDVKTMEPPDGGLQSINSGEQE